MTINLPIDVHAELKRRVEADGRSIQWQVAKLITLWVGESKSEFEHVEKEPIVKVRKKSEPTIGTRDLIAHYCDKFSERYGKTPVITGKVSGLAKTLLKSMSLLDACQLVDNYLSNDDQWFVKQRHSFETFVSNLNKVKLNDTSLDIPKTKRQIEEEAMMKRFMERNSKK